MLICLLSLSLETHTHMHAYIGTVILFLFISKFEFMLFSSVFSFLIKYHVVNIFPVNKHFRSPIYMSTVMLQWLCKFAMSIREIFKFLNFPLWQHSYYQKCCFCPNTLGSYHMSITYPTELAVPLVARNPCHSLAPSPKGICCGELGLWHIIKSGQIFHSPFKCSYVSLHNSYIYALNNIYLHQVLLF